MSAHGQNAQLRGHWALWRLGHYHEFLEARRDLLAAEANRQLADLLHGDTHWLEGRTSMPALPFTGVMPADTADEQDGGNEIEMLNEWLEGHGLPRGQSLFELADAATGEQIAVLDAAWPRGVQEGLSQPAALHLSAMLDETAAIGIVGFRCFSSVEAFKQYVRADILAELSPA